MNPGFRIMVAPGGRSASISIMSPSVPEEDILAELAVNNIIAGIHPEAIRSALESVKHSGMPVHDITVASSGEKRIGLVFDMPAAGTPGADGTLLSRRFSETAHILAIMKQGGPYQGEHRALFVRQGQQFLFEEHPDPFTDIYGQQLDDTQFFQHDDSVSVSRTAKRITYTAEKNGYVTLREQSGIVIEEIFVVDDSRMTMDCIILPCEWDFKALFETLSSRSTAGKPGGIAPPVTREALHEMITSGRAHRLAFRKGIPAGLSENGRIEIMVHAHTGKEDASGGRIDQRKRTPFIEVTADTVIAVKILPRQGTPGFDVYGNEIPVAAPDDVSFRAGTNVIEKEEFGRRVYIAATTGFLKLSEDGAEVTESLVIDGDIDFSTGNIASSRDVSVNGTVIGGFTVKSEGTVTIGGSIEDGSRITTKGNLAVRGGVFGGKTVVEADGDADIGFIQEGVVRVKGALTVKKYIYGASIFCGKTLSVEGNGVSGTERGCVLGGDITAMESMELASAGSPAVKTRLYCGVNHEIVTLVATARNQIVSLNRRATNLRYSIPVDIDASDAVARLASQPPHIKEKARTVLLELKKVTEQLRYITSQLPHLERQQYAKTPENCHVTIKKQCIPEVDIHIVTDVTVVNEETHGVTLQFDAASGKIKGKS